MNAQLPHALQSALQAAIQPVQPPVVMPHSISSEEALLGAILQQPDCIDAVRHIVLPSDFYQIANGQIFGLMCDRRDSGESISFGVMKAAAGNADLGGLTVGQYISRLMLNASTLDAPSYARLIAQAARMRTILVLAQEAVTAMSVTEGQVFDPSTYAAEMIETLDQVASAALPEQSKRTTLLEAAGRVIKQIDRIRQGFIRRGARYGVARLDKATLGARAGQLIILAGRPGMGKTALAVHIGVSAARFSGPVAFFSLEMDDGEISERVLSQLAYNPRDPDSLTYRAIAEAEHLSDQALVRVHDAERECRSIPFWIEQQPALTLGQIAARSRQMKLKAEREGKPLSAIIVDHIGLIRPSKRYSGNRVQEMTEISGGLKALAKELRIPVIALSQLNREVEKREQRRPQLSDLRDSGSIEQDADVVLSVFREGYYIANQENPSDEELDRLFRVKNVLEIEILKQRGGPTRRFEVFCDIASNVISDMAQ